MKNNFCVFLDAGHGALNKSGRYVTAGKQYLHASGTFHNGRWFYEGVWNRMITEAIATKLHFEGIEFHIISHPWIDTSLAYRVAKVTYLSQFYKHTLTLSNHANAYKHHNVEGFEVHLHPFAGRGSRKFSELLYKHHSKLGYPQRSEKRNRWAITSGPGPAALIEWDYYDFLRSANRLMSSVEAYAAVAVEAIKEYLEWLEV